MYPEFALWCGTTATADWHTRYNAVCSVYGHLHIPRTTYYDGVRFEEVSLGYPREWRGVDCRRSSASDSSGSGVPAGNAQQVGWPLHGDAGAGSRSREDARRTLRGIAT